jgi:hypothetical protein
MLRDDIDIMSGAIIAVHLCMKYLIFLIWQSKWPFAPGLEPVGDGCIAL